LQHQILLNGQKHWHLLCFTTVKLGNMNERAEKCEYV